MGNDLEGFTEMVGEVGGEHTLLGMSGRGEVAGKAVEVDAEEGGFTGGVRLAEEGGENAGEDVAAAALGHTGVAGRIEIATAAGHGDQTVVALEHDDHAEPSGLFAGLFAAGVIVLGGAEKPFEFLGVGREDRVGGQEGEQFPMGSEDIEGVGVHNHGFFILLEEGAEEGDGGLVLTQARADADNRIFVEPGGQRRVDPLVGVHHQHGFGEGRLQDAIAAAWDIAGEQAAAGAKAGPRGQEGGPHLAIAAGHQQSMTEIAFMGKTFPGFVDGFDDSGIEELRLAAGAGLKEETGMQADVEDMDLTHPALVLGHQEGRFVDLEAEGMGGAHNRITLRTPADEQPAGDIDGDDLVTCAIEMFHQLCSDTLQLAIEAGSQQRVDEDICRGNGMEMLRALYKPDLHRRRVKPRQVVLEVLCSDVPKFEDMNRYGAIEQGQHPGEGQAVPTVIALSAINGKGAIEISGSLQPGQTTGRGTLHQIDGGDGFVLHGIFVPGPDLLG